MAFVATLIANPSNPVLTFELGESAARMLNASGLYWLADGIACDLALRDDTDPLNALMQLRQVTGNLAIDVAVQRFATRRKKLLLADMDSTMIDQECIDELAAEVGLKAKVAEITARAMNGEIEFEPALRERVSLLKGLPVAVISKVIEKRITLAAGGAVLVATMRADGAKAALVSGGFTLFTGPVARMLGFDENRANHLEIDGDKLSGTVREPILGKQAKVDALEEYAKQYSITASDIIAVGDGANDLGMLERAGTGVALHAKPSVAAQADIRIDHGDLTALLYLQGYRKADFAKP